VIAFKQFFHATASVLGKNLVGVIGLLIHCFPHVRPCSPGRGKNSGVGAAAMV
jgi:hypothetical protein